MSCVWWDCDLMAPIQWEFFPANEAIGRYGYLVQLHRINQAIREKRPDKRSQIILIHHNTGPYTANIVEASFLDSE